MWKIAVFAIICVCAVVASAGALPVSDEDVSEEDCYNVSECDDDCKFVRVDGDCYKMATESQNKCEIQEQCAKISGTLCIDGSCVGQKGLGEPCTGNSECTSELVCNSGHCECPLGNVQFGDTCLIQAGALGDNCEQDVQCEGVTGVCRDGTCQAKSHPVPLCNDENAETSGNECRCRDGFVESEDGKSCLKEAEKIGDECKTTQQCESVNGTCTGGICTTVTLSAAAIPNDATPILIGSACESDADCSSVNDAVCKESVCQCGETHIPSEDSFKCLPFAKKAGDSCETNKQCSKVPNSSCLDGKCAAVATASTIKNRKSGTSSPFATSAHVVMTTIIMIGSRAIFA